MEKAKLDAEWHAQYKRECKKAKKRKIKEATEALGNYFIFTISLSYINLLSVLKKYFQMTHWQNQWWVLPVSVVKRKNNLVHSVLTAKKDGFKKYISYKFVSKPLKFSLF